MNTGGVFQRDRAPRARFNLLIFMILFSFAMPPSLAYILLN